MRCMGLHGRCTGMTSRDNNEGLDRAIQTATDALGVHKGTGRLWATKVQLTAQKPGGQQME
eukprot:gene7081-16794_t